jgi:hypothetical protein
MRDRGAKHRIGGPCRTRHPRLILRQGLGCYFKGWALQETSALLRLREQRFDFAS